MMTIGHGILWFLSIWSLVHGVLVLTRAPTTAPHRNQRRRLIGAALFAVGACGLTLPGSALLAAISLAFRNV